MAEPESINILVGRPSTTPSTTSVELLVAVIVLLGDFRSDTEGSSDEHDRACHISSTLDCDYISSVKMSGMQPPPSRTAWTLLGPLVVVANGKALDLLGRTTVSLKVAGMKVNRKLITHVW